MKTLVLGASSKPSRYAYLAVKSLQKHGHKVIPIGRKAQTVEDWEIFDGKPQLEDIHTVTLYLSAKNQSEYIDYIFSLKPERVIFNPGAENELLEQRLMKEGVETLEACTLVMLSTGQY